MSNREDSYSRLQKKLQRRRAESRYRTLNVVDETSSSRFIRMDGKEYLNFSSNDYLNLSNHATLKERSCTFTERYGAGSSSSRLVTGTLHIHRDLEKKLASLYHKEEALLFSTGFQANSTILPAVTEKNDVIIADELCHNSILAGCIASRAKVYRFRHNDMDHLETFLKRKSGEKNANIWIVTESLFSMDGDRAPLQDIIRLAIKYSSKIYVDDAHALGVYGEKGMGYGADYPEVDILVSTLGKAAGVFGAFVASSAVIINSLVNYCSGFIYSTAPPPSVVGAIDASLELIPGMKTERNHLQELSVFLNSQFRARNFETTAEPTHIQPLIFGGEDYVLSLEKKIREAGIVVTAIRPPTVPENRSRFRISLTSAHQKSDFEKFLNVLDHE